MKRISDESPRFRSLHSLKHESDVALTFLCQSQPVPYVGKMLAMARPNNAFEFEESAGQILTMFSLSLRVLGVYGNLRLKLGITLAERSGLSNDLTTDQRKSVLCLVYPKFLGIVFLGCLAICCP